MLNQKLAKEVILAHIFKPTTPDNEDIMSLKMGLPCGSVRFGPKAIEITEDGKTAYAQITPEGNNVVFLDVPPA